jgi:hypothetical protein
LTKFTEVILCFVYLYPGITLKELQDKVFALSKNKLVIQDNENVPFSDLVQEIKSVRLVEGTRCFLSDRLTADQRFRIAVGSYLGTKYFDHYKEGCNPSAIKDFLLKSNFDGVPEDKFITSLEGKGLLFLS